MGRRYGLGRYTVLQRDPARGPGAGWIVYDSHRQRAVRTYRGRRGLERAERRAGKLNRKAAR
jgi:hypothetical protein